MLDLPPPVIAYLLAFIKEKLSLAYLFVNKNGSLSTWGGKLAAYGITNLQKGDNAKEQVFFLEGLLPLDDFPLFIPCLKTEHGICADVHIFPTQHGDWVLLLDATGDEMQIRLLQQQTNDSSLWQEKSTKII